MIITHEKITIRTIKVKTAAEPAIVKVVTGTPKGEGGYGFLFSVTVGIGSIGVDVRLSTMPLDNNMFTVEKETFEFETPMSVNLENVFMLKVFVSKTPVKTVLPNAA